MAARKVDRVGTAQVAAILGVTPAAVSNYRARESWPEGFPVPVAWRAGAIPQWDRRSIERYARAHAATIAARRGTVRPRLSPDARAARDADIRARRAAGETLAAIGASHGLTRERVRQLTTGPGQTFTPLTAAVTMEG